MVQQWEAIEIDIGGRTHKVRSVNSGVLQSNELAAEPIAVSQINPWNGQLDSSSGT